MEQWKRVVIDGIEWDYEVCNKEGKVRNMKTGRILKQHKTKIGYSQVTLSKYGIVKSFLVHRLVATMFIPNPNSYSDVDHIDRNRQNNSVENLRWLPHENNIPINPTERKILCVETGQIFDSSKHVQRETGLNQSNILKCCKGQGYKTVGGFHWEFVD